MRLTLRTLLAWLDGLLPEADRRDLAARVAASQVAPLLVERIGEAVARPGLPAPGPDGSGLAGDANTAAEFLDNALPVDRLEAFERICLESEIHLAEVADCHAILAELTRDAAAAAPPQPAARARLLDLISRATSDTSVDPRREEAAALGKLMQDANPVAPATVPIPRPRRVRAPWGAWLSVGAAIGLLVVLGGMLLRQVWGPAGGGRQVAGADRDAASSAPRSPVPEAASASVSPPREPEPEPAGSSDVEPTPQAEPEPAAAVVASPPEPIDSTATAFPPPAEPVVIPLPVMEVDEPPPAAPEAAPTVVPPVPTPPRSAGIVEAGGPLLHRVIHGDSPGWRAVFAGASIADAEEFIVPFHGYPQIVRGDVSIRLLPGTRCAMSVDRDGTPRLEIVFGRAVVWTEAAEPRLGISAGGLTGVFTLGPRQPVGIDVELTRDRGTDPAVVPSGRVAMVYAAGGGRWRQTESDGGPPGPPLAGLPLEQPLPPRGGLTWDSSAAGAARILPPASEPVWMKLTGPVHAIDRYAAEAMSKTLAADVPAAESLAMLAGSRRVEDRMAAAATLTLLGSYDALVEALCDESQARRLREGQWNALEASTVPLALARGANAAAALRQAFEAHGPTGRAAEIFLMARGLSAEELAAGGAEGLVASLEDSSLVIRRYALANLVALLPDPAAATHDYRPDRSGRLNDKGIAWWRERVAAGLAGRRGDSGGEP